MEINFVLVQLLLVLISSGCFGEFRGSELTTPGSSIRTFGGNSSHLEPGDHRGKRKHKPSSGRRGGKCSDGPRRHRNIDTVLLARMTEDPPVSNGTRSIVFYVDSSISDLNITTLGWRFKLWKPSEAMKDDALGKVCLSKVLKDDGRSRFEFSEDVGPISETGQNGIPGATTDTGSGCREIPTETCVQIGGDDQTDGQTEGQTCAGFLSIGSPSPGLRYLQLFREFQVDPTTDTSRAEVTVTGRSYLKFKFRFTNPITAQPLSGHPVAGELSGIGINFSCVELLDLSKSALVISSQSGQELDRKTPIQPGINLIKIPLQDFNVGVYAVDVQGHRLVRISPRLVRPRMMVLSFTTPAHIEELHPLQNLDVGVRLRNKGRRDTFSVRATFSTYVDYLTVNISPEVLEVAHNAHAEIHILVSVHKSISQRIDPRLTVEVTRMSDNSSTSLSRFIKATPTSFGEDAEPPSCVLFYEFSQCDDEHTDEDCADSVWEAAVSVKDISGVYRATFANPSSRLISSIAYKQVHGRLKAEARLRRDCCTLNASLLVEDYMGNQQVCTLNATDMPLDPKGRAPGSKPKRGRQKHGKKHGKSKTTPYDEIEEVSLEPTTGTSVESDVYVDTTQRTEGKTQDESQDDQTDFWSPQLKEKVKIGAIIFGFACFLLIAYCVVYLHSQTVKNTENPSEGKIRTPAFHFPNKRSNRGTASTGKTNPGQLEMENLGQPTSGSPKNKGQEIETVFSSEGQQSSIVKADPKNATIPSVDGNTLDEAYSSLCFCTTADISKPASQKATSEIADISHIEPKNKTDIYERILQFRDLLEQLEKKRATLVSSLNFKHHTVPRVKQDLWQPDVDWDSENDGFDDDVDNDDDNDDDDDIDNKDITNNIELKNLNESNKNPDGSFENPAFLATESDLEIPNILGESPERDIGQGYLSPQCRKRHQKSKLPVTKDHDCDDIWHDHVTRNSVTPPELSQGHMCMMIEGATQISLRHEIRKLKERLLQCSREVEDALRYERDFCDTLSNDEEEQEDSEFEQM